MRTTVDLPDPIFRRMKAKAALEGLTLKQVFLRAIERDLTAPPAPKKKRVKLPLIKGTPGQVIRPLTGAEMDELLFG
jgi:hypothetical protein